MSMWIRSLSKLCVCVCSQWNLWEEKGVNVALRAVCQGVIIYTGFELIWISGVLRCDAGITGNACTSAPSDSRALGAWLGVWSCIAGPRVHGPPSLQLGIAKKTTCCASKPWPTNQFYVKPLTKPTVFRPQIIIKRLFFCCKIWCMWKWLLWTCF